MSAYQQYLLDFYKLVTVIIHRQAKDVTHPESLLQPPFRGNCMNWVIGHILTSRDVALGVLGLPPVLTPEENAAYSRGSMPLTEVEHATLLPVLIEKLDRSLAEIRAAIEARDDAQMMELVEFGSQPQPLNDVLAFQLWHETYHTGQLELLRQLAGKDDKVI